MKYLSEIFLGEILNEIFKDCKISTQYKYNYTKVDFCIELDKFNNICNILPNYNNMPIKLLIEFDGFYHYSKISQCVKDIKNKFGNICWKKLDDIHYGIRIPYYIQLDEYFSKNLFNIDHKLNDYPHGFIDKKCVLPSDFCYYGDIRFIKELNNIPFDIGNLIYKSLIEKCKFPKKSENIMSNIVSDFLIKRFDNEFYNNYKNGLIKDLNDSRYRLLYFNDKYKTNLELI